MFCIKVTIHYPHGSCSDVMRRLKHANPSWPDNCSNRYIKYIFFKAKKQ